MTIEVSSLGMTVQAIILLGMLVGYRQLTDEEPSLPVLIGAVIFSFLLAMPIVFGVVVLVR